MIIISALKIFRYCALNHPAHTTKIQHVVMCTVQSTNFEIFLGPLHLSKYYQLHNDVDNNNFLNRIAEIKSVSKSSDLWSGNDSK